MTTFPRVLAALLSTEPGRPLITCYDETTGERTELSVTTYANWVAKASSLLVDELDVEPGSSLVVDLPTHWLGPVFLGAAWNSGLVVHWPGDGVRPDAVVTGPAGLDRWAPYAGDVPVLACALTPLGRPFDQDLPPGVLDVGREIWSQPDGWAPWQPPGEDDLAVADGDRTWTQAEMWDAATAGSSLTGGGRILSEANPASPSGLVSLTGPLVTSGSLVLVAHAPDAGRVAAIAAAERATPV